MRRNQSSEGTRKPGKGYMPEGGWDPVYVLRPSVALSKGGQGRTGGEAAWRLVRGVCGHQSGWEVTPLAWGHHPCASRCLKRALAWQGGIMMAPRGELERPGRGRGNARPQTS